MRLASGYIVVQNSNTPFTNVPFTVETWFNMETIASDWYTVIGNDEYEIHLDWNSRISVWDNGAGTLTGYQTIESNRWYHVAFVNDGQSRRIYLNGLLDVEANDAGALKDDVQQLWIGNDPAPPNRHFNCLVDEVRVWNVARSEEEIRNNINQHLTGAEDGLVGYWNFDQGVAMDASGNDNHGALHGDASIVEADFPHSPIAIQNNIDIGSLLVGESRSASVTIQNASSQELQIQNVTAEIAVEQTALSVPSWSSANIAFTFTPTNTGQILVQTDRLPTPEVIIVLAEVSQPLTNSEEIEDLIEKYSDSNNFNIIFDYRYDNGFISDNRERQKTMDYIEDLYESIIISSHTVAANTSLKIRRSYTSTGFDTISYPKGANGFVIFVVAYDFSKYKTAQGVLEPRTSLKAYGATTGIDNIGIIHINTKKGNKWFFDSTPDTINDLPSKTHYDAISTIVHELGHTFKILRYHQQPYIIKEGGIEKFNGKNTRSKNKGAALPLDTGSSHISEYFGPIEYLVRPQLDRLMMHGSDPIQGFRTLMSLLDMAMLDDLGYDIDYSKIPKPLYGNPSDLKKYQSQNLQKHIQSTATTKPVGLWVFNNAKSAHNSVIGAPMKYMLPARKTGILPELYQDNHIKVPKGGYLIINHALTDGSQYSLLMDVKLTNNATWIPLFNTNYTALNLRGTLY